MKKIFDEKLENDLRFSFLVILSIINLGILERLVQILKKVAK